MPIDVTLVDDYREVCIQLANQSIPVVHVIINSIEA